MEKKIYIYLVIISLMKFVFSENSMQFHEQFKYLFNGGIHDIVYKLLKTNPISKNINFFVTHPDKFFMQYNENKIDKNQLPKLNGGFIVSDSDNYESYIPLLKEIGINTIFACSAKNKNYTDINVVAIPYVINKKFNKTNKDIFYSFVGTDVTNPVRKKIFSTKHPSNCVIIKRENFHGFQSKENRLIYEKEYIEILSRSRFSLCPKGLGSGTFRFWGSLYARAIPVLISDDYLLPKGIDWSKCIVIVKEADIEKIPEILSKIDECTEKEMLENCSKIIPLFYGENFVKVIRDYYA